MFTYQERLVILFLILTAIFGIGINFLNKRYPKARRIYYFNIDLERVNLNRADKETLITIPGIGEKLAQRIVEYREKNQEFTEIEEIRKIRGMNSYRYEKVKDYLYIE